MRNLSTPLGLSKFDGDDKKKKGTQKKQTPFQDYMQNPGAVASDTTSRTILRDPVGFVKEVNKAKKPSNQKALNQAYKSTYGDKGINEGTTNSDCGFANSNGRCSSSYTRGSKQYKKEVIEGMSKDFDSYARKNYSPIYDKKSKLSVTKPALKKSKIAPSGTQKRRDQYDARGWKQDKTTAIRKNKK
jgi:hypothetical protein